MITRSVRSAVAASAVLLLSLSACTGEEDPGLLPGSDSSQTLPFTGNPEPTLNGEPWDGRVIPGAVQIDFDGSEYGYTKHERPFVARVRYGADGPVEVNDRRLPGCQDPSSPLAIDGVVTDFIADIAEDGPYLVARQLTAYPDVATAAKFSQQMQSQASECNDFRGEKPASYVRSGYTFDRFVAGPSRYDDRDYSQGHLTTTDERVNMRWIDVVSRFRNVVALTRVAQEGYAGEPDVIGRLDAEPRFAAQLRREVRTHDQWFAAFDDYR